MSNREIARRRGISLDAVKFHVANALDKLGLERRAQLRMWRGIPFDSALNSRKDGTLESKLALGPIGQISRVVKDIKRAEEWYGGVLGLPHLYTFGNLAFFDCGGTRLFLEQEGEAGGDTIELGPESVLYFRVPDINAAYEELTARGVTFTDAPHMIFRHPDGMEEWMAFFKDPEGRPLSIMCQVRP
jgi:catechol 2,3-dioxygenase-like lactoylglutathione lyase family enzyme